MVKFDVDGAQNVEVSAKIPCEKSPEEQLRIMVQYTETHKSMAKEGKEKREAACLEVLYPTLFREIEDGDLFAGRLDFLPIGFGSVTSVGGVGHYCVFNKLKAFKEQLTCAAHKEKVDELYDYWLHNDVKTKYCEEILTDTTIGRFIDCNYPLIATARLSGMMLDYETLLQKGIPGVKHLLEAGLEKEPQNEFLLSSLRCMALFCTCAKSLAQKAEKGARLAKTAERKKQLSTIGAGLLFITERKPETFHQAIQLFWLYSLLAGVINYGRADDFLGPFLARDLQNGTLSPKEAHDYVKSLWTMIENRRTTVNGRIIVGGKGRKHPKEADVFLHIALRVAKECRYVEPQFTLRVTEETGEDVWDEALDALGAGATYPTIYNDEVNVPAVSFGMRVEEKTAQQYVPFGCTEFVLQGQSTGTPNVCMNLLKILTVLLNGGIDPVDGKEKMGTVRPLLEYTSFDQFYGKYKELLGYYMDLSIHAQLYSYELMNREVSFLFTSVLMEDCIGRGKAVLDGGIRFLGGTNEIYGLINVSDSLLAMKKLIFEEKRYSLSRLNQALISDFAGEEKLRRELWHCEKYGNDLDAPDTFAKNLYEYVAKGVRNRGIENGMRYYLVVISNNQLNTEWGRTTGASPDGRHKGMFMNPANNPQGGANQNGPTAMLNSLAKIDAKYHAGSVQNIKFTPTLFNENREMIKALFKTYFRRGGCHIMVTVVGRGTLEDAVRHPENYPDLIVRVSGFSAVFVNLAPDIQEELMSRVLYE
ncbi:MAG: pyruvate formate lyase family protein [Oscillospiraceae bacterium]